MPKINPTHTPTTDSIEAACLAVARHYHGKKGEGAYALYTEINRAFFAGELPWPNITWALTPHGACLGSVSVAGPPVIVLHPSLLEGSEKENPWEVPRVWLGWRFAADVLLHEALHLSVRYRLGGWSDKGETSHNNDVWVEEVNRLLPLLRIPGSEACQAGRSMVRRVPTDGPLTKRGKTPTRIERVTEGNLPFKVVAGFPGALRQHLRKANAYYQGIGPACLDACAVLETSEIVVPPQSR